MLLTLLLSLCMSVVCCKIRVDLDEQPGGYSGPGFVFLRRSVLQLSKLIEEPRPKSKIKPSDEKKEKGKHIHACTPPKGARVRLRLYKPTPHRSRGRHQASGKPSFELRGQRGGK